MNISKFNMSTKGTSYCKILTLRYELSTHSDHKFNENLDKILPKEETK